MKRRRAIRMLGEYCHGPRANDGPVMIMMRRMVQLVRVRINYARDKPNSL